VDFSQVLKNRRSIRDFQDKDVPINLVHEIIEESCLAPSSMNGQPWSFIMINNRDLIKKLSDESKKNILSKIAKNPDYPLKRYEGVLKVEAFNVFYNAPCVVLITGPRAMQSSVVDCTLLASYFMLCAAAKGLGTCWIGLGAHIQDPKIKKEIGLPDDQVIIAPLSLGYPTKIPEALKRMPPKILKIVE
jgi:nitroreductase